MYSGATATSSRRTITNNRKLHIDRPEIGDKQKIGIAHFELGLPSYGMAIMVI
jgi:hypothetical protein